MMPTAAHCHGKFGGELPENCCSHISIAGKFNRELLVVTEKYFIVI
jgi:hypothetical protein